jgi:hypothetical protein
MGNFWIDRTVGKIVNKSQVWAGVNFDGVCCYIFFCFDGKAASAASCAWLIHHYWSW